MEQVIREFQERPPAPTSPLPYPGGTPQGSMPSIPPVGSYPPTSAAAAAGGGGGGGGFAPYHYSSVPTQLSDMHGHAPESPENRPRHSAPTLVRISSPKLLSVVLMVLTFLCVCVCSLEVQGGTNVLLFLRSLRKLAR